MWRCHIYELHRTIIITMIMIITFALTTTASPPTIVSSRLLPLDTGDQQISRNFCCLSHGVEIHLCHMECYICKAQVVLSENSSGEKCCCYSRGASLGFWWPLINGTARPPLKAHSDLTTDFMSHLPGSVSENWTLRSNSAPAIQVSILLWREISI